MSFSGALQLTGLDDFIAPSQSCVLPMASEPTSSSGNANSKVSIEADGSYVEINDRSGEKRVLKKAEITLNDCLACSGCVTSAETVLIAAQSLKEFSKYIGRGDVHIVVSVSPQSRASIAAHFDMSLACCHASLVTFFRQYCNAKAVVDTSFAQRISLLETLYDFLHRYRQQRRIQDDDDDSSASMLPLLASSCPGWVCYAEKRHGDVALPRISTVKSPQQVTGSLVKRHYAEKFGVDVKHIYHVTVMPCYDKKLEASRPDFYDADADVRDVDVVLTSAEIVELIVDTMHVRHLSDIEPATSCDDEFHNRDQNVHTMIDDEKEQEGGRGGGGASSSSSSSSSVPSFSQFFGMPGGSGGYAEYVYRRAAKLLFDIDIADGEPLPWKSNRNKDMRTLTLRHPETKRVLLTFAIVYGFRNIQTLMRRIKSNRCTYDYAEVMACPSGCLNGGGQVRVDVERQRDVTPKQRLEQVDRIYHSQRAHVPPSLPEPDIAAIYRRYCDNSDQPRSKAAIKLFHTQYHRIEPLPESTYSVNPSALKW
jgi:cytosolic iron-sulfur assembly component 3